LIFCDLEIILDFHLAIGTLLERLLFLKLVVTHGMWD